MVWPVIYSAEKVVPAMDGPARPSVMALDLHKIHVKILHQYITGYVVRIYSLKMLMWNDDFQMFELSYIE